MVSILVGVNDIGAVVYNRDPETIEQFEERYHHILEITRAALPDSLIVLCEPFILPMGRVNEKTETWQAEVKKQQVVVRKLAEWYHAIFVELQEPFRDACKNAPQDYWIWDGIHPMPAGHELIVRAWIQEVRKKLTFIKG